MREFINSAVQLRTTGTILHYVMVYTHTPHNIYIHIRVYNSNNNNNNKSYARYTEADTAAVEGLRKEVVCVCSLVPACNNGGRVTDGRRETERVMERAERARGGYIIPIQKTKLCLHCGEARALFVQCYRGPRTR